jgi:hypothetical protein
MTNKSQKGKQMKQTIYNKLKTGYTSLGKYYLNTADVATLIIKELNSVFPNVKFQKQTERFAGGSSVDIYLADSFDFMNQICDSTTNPGITNNQLANMIVNNYSKGFDGMIDLAYSSEYILTKNDEVYKVSCKGTEDAGGSVPKKEYKIYNFPDYETALPVNIYCYANYSSRPKFGSKAYELYQEYKKNNQQQEAA